MASPPSAAAPMHRHLRLATSNFEGSTGDNHVPAAAPDAVSPDAEAGLVVNRRSGKRPAARGTAFYPRKRANTACQVCRARKTKCDNKKPSCSYCLSVGATCIQSAVDLSSFDPASLKILDRLDELERLLRAAAASTVQVTAAAAAENVIAMQHVSSLISPTDAAFLSQQTPLLLSQYNTFQGDARRSSCLSSSSSCHGKSRHSEDGFFEQAGPQPGSNDLAQPPRSGRVEDDFLLDSVLPTRVDCILEWPIFQNSKMFLGSPVYRAQPDAMASPDGAASLALLVDMESHRIYRLLDNFFFYVHCKNPILDESTARKMVGRAFLDGIDWSPASCLAMIICALGCIASPYGPPSVETKMGTQAYADSQVFFQAAQKRIGILLVKSDIVGAQCLFLSGIYMMMVFQPIYAWRFFSQALAACQHFPFLVKVQDLSTNAAVSPVSVGLGQRDTQEQAVYWSAWKSERELRGEISLPDFDIHHSGSTLYPPFFPAPPPPPPDSLDCPDSERRSRASWMFYLAEISLRRLTSRLCSVILNLQQRYASNSAFLDVLAEQIPEFEAQAQGWSDSLPDELSLRMGVDEDDIARSVLRGKLINLYEIIYWPFIMMSLSICESGQLPKAHYLELVNRGLDTHMHQIRANELGFQHRHHGTFFMIRACTRSAFSLLAAFKSGLSMPRNWDEAVYKVVGMLAYWEEEDRDVAGWKSRLERELSPGHG